MIRDFTKPEHLPNRRRDGRPPETSWLPRQRRGVAPQMIGRYPDFDVFDDASSWDDATRRVIEVRMLVHERSLEFFSLDEGPTLRAFCDVAMAQDGEPRVPVAELIDETLAAGRLDGYQYADMPDDRVTWHAVIRGLDEIAERRYGAASFDALAAVEQAAVVDQFSKGELDGGVWQCMDAKKAFAVCMRFILSAFYSHPWAWNEIGFGGPAYPRGYMRLGPLAVREPFEAPGATDEDPVRATSPDRT